MEYVEIPTGDDFVALPKEEQISVINDIVENYKLRKSGYLSYLSSPEMQNTVQSLSTKCSTARYLLVTLFSESGVTSELSEKAADLLGVMLKPEELSPIYSVIAACDARAIKAICLATGKSKKYHNKTS